MRGTLEGRVYRPLVLVSISVHGSSPQDVWMLLDSGADNTTIPMVLATGLSGMDQAAFGPATDKQKGLEGVDIETWILPAELSYRGTVFAKQVSANVVPRPVLGREDFMRVFDVQIQWGNVPPEFHVALSPSRAKPKNLALRPKRKH